VNARIRRFLGRDGGAVLPLTAVFLVVALGVMALAIDLGRVFLVKSELQRAADAAALAGALGLVTPPGGLPGLTTMSPNCGRATALAQAVFTSNHADGLLLSMVNGTISLGIWNSGTGVFTDTGCAVPALVNAVQAVAQKTISLYFGGIITGSPTMPLSAQALVLVGSVGSVPPGARVLPLAIDSDKVPSNGQPVVIHLNPSPLDTGCWHTFFWQNPASSLLRDLITGAVESPALKVGDLIKVKEGVDNATLKELGGELDRRGGTWDVLLPVIPAGSHTGWLEVLGFCPIRLTLVDSQGQNKRLEGTTLENYVGPGLAPGGPSYFGLWSGSPRLIQ